MESNGLPQMIHCSHATYEALQVFGSFQLEFREELQVKGKPKMKLVDCKHITRSLTAAQLSVIFKKN